MTPKIWQPSRVMVGAALLLQTACVMSREAGNRLSADTQSLRTQVTALARSMETLKAEFSEERELTHSKLAGLSRTVDVSDKTSKVNDADFLTQLERIGQQMQELRGALDDSEHRLGENQTKLESELAGRIQALQAAAIAAEKSQAALAAKATSKAPSKTKQQQLQYGLKLMRQANGKKEGRAVLRDLAQRYSRERGIGDEALFALGKASFGENSYEAALRDLVGIVDLKPPSPRAAEAYYTIALSSLALGRNDDAKTFLTEVVSHYGTSSVAKAAKKKLEALGRGQPAAPTTK